MFLGICRHLIGFFLFLALTIYTATKVPSVVDLHSLQHRLPDVLRKTDLHKLHSDLMSRLPSSPSSWHVMELLYNCLPERFSHGNYTDMCVLVNKTKNQSFSIFPHISVFKITSSLYLYHIAAFGEGRSCKHDSSFDLPANYSMALLCISRRSNVLFISKQHMPPPLMSLRASLLHNAKARLRWNCSSYCNFLLPSSLLLLHV